MLIFRGFIAGFCSVFSISWPKCEVDFYMSKKKVMKDDWHRISKDLKNAIVKYKIEVKNDKK